jgi:hypothetical protein
MTALLRLTALLGALLIGCAGASATERGSDSARESGSGATEQTYTEPASEADTETTSETERTSAAGTSTAPTTGGGSGECQQDRDCPTGERCYCRSPGADPCTPDMSPELCAEARCGGRFCSAAPPAPRPQAPMAEEASL